MPAAAAAAGQEVSDGLIWTEVQEHEITYVGSPKELHEELKAVLDSKCFAGGTALLVIPWSNKSAHSTAFFNWLAAQGFRQLDVYTGIKALLVQTLTGAGMHSTLCFCASCASLMQSNAAALFYEGEHKLMALHLFLTMEQARWRHVFT
jgi:hypothetical protein